MNRPASFCSALAGCLGLLALLSPGLSPAAEQLRSESSAFLRENAGSPVDWRPWGTAAFAEAQRAQRPVFVFVGSFTNQLSRSMCRQTFANPDTARALNQNYVCVLVDAMEHPEVAALYHQYLGEVKQIQGLGLPLNLWLTPDLLPFEGSNYLPPTEEWGKASFAKFAGLARQAWKTDPAACRKRAADAVAQLAADSLPAPVSAVPAGKTPARLTAAAAAWLGLADAANGGFGDPPKTAEPELLRFLLRQAPADRAAALATLRAIAASPLRDPLDGGFFHSAGDAAWHVSSPQKILADQARDALAFLAVNEGDDAKAFAGAARGALDFVLNRLTHPDGTFAAAEDATADEFAGYYAWTQAETNQVLGPQAAAFETAHHMTAEGNVPAGFDLGGRFKGKNLLASLLVPDVADQAAAARLLAVRDRRPAPPRDERATAGAHGLMLAALARAGEVLDEPRYRLAAARTFDVIKQKFLLPPTGGVRRFSGSLLPASPADYAALALGCREFARTARRPDAAALADRLLARASDSYFQGKSGRFFATPATLPPGIFLRPLATDEQPSAESLALLAGLPPAQAQPVADALSAALEDDGKPPGDVLLALSLRP